MSSSQRSAYRPEIDGLRAVAVLAVILFHARVRGFSGGFVGVDVFLVISGYLIAQLILRESEAGSFTLIGFYERRVRRILPALLAMLAVAGGAGWMLLPVDFRPFGESLTAISLLASNILFWRWDGYFSLAKDATPLLHTWSLAVEEQFYIVFPALLVQARRSGPRRTRLLLAAAALASFAYSVWAVQSHPEAAFYSPLSRAWEFLAGALLAAGATQPFRHRLSGDIVSTGGVALIAFAIVQLRDESAFPGVEALAPVIGTMLILAGTEAPGSRIARLFAARPFVAIGLISYSLYLWHWPLIVFGGYYAFNPFGPVRLLLALLAFPVAWASWRFVELPFRKPRLLLSRRALFASALAASAILALYGAVIYRAQGFPARMDPAVQRLSQRGLQPDYGCANRPVSTLRTNSHCRIGDTASRPSFVIWGDSHAAVYFPALDMMARRLGVSGYNASRLGCPPLISVRPRDDRPAKWMLRTAKLRQCAAHNAQVLRFLAEERPKAVLLAAEWSVYGRSPEPAGEAFEAGVRRLRALGISVYVVQDVPSAPFAEPRVLAKAQLLDTMDDIEPDLRGYIRRDAAFRAVTTALRRQGLIQVIEPGWLLCGRTRCRLTDHGYPLYFDSNHLNRRGALFVAPIFEPVMHGLASQRAAIN